MVAIWLVAFGVVGITSMDLTTTCPVDSRADSVDGYQWDRDRYNDCAWTLYRGTYPLRTMASEQVYLDNGLIPPTDHPPLDRWQALLILTAAGITGPLGLWRQRVRDEEEPATAGAPAPADAV